MKGKLLKILAVLGCLTLTAGVVACGNKSNGGDGGGASSSAFSDSSDEQTSSSEESVSINSESSTTESSSSETSNFDYESWLSNLYGSEGNSEESSAVRSEEISQSFSSEKSANEENSEIIEESSTVVEEGSESIAESSDDLENSSSEEEPDPVDGISFKTLSVDGTNVYGKVSNGTETFSFADEIEVNGNAKYIVSLDEYGTQTVITKTIPLAIGDNVVYIFETVDGEITATYVVTIRRRPMYSVTFNVNGGSTVEQQTVEEGSLVQEPATTKVGYTLAGWDYDFSMPITEDTDITADWTANTDTKYTVNHYVQNIDDDEYTLYETEDLTGITDTTVTADIKEYTHFTRVGEDIIEGNINGDGSLVLDVYYERNTYMVVTGANVAGGGVYTQSNTMYRYGKEISLASTTNIGYNWQGWYDGETLVYETEEFKFNVEKDVTYTAMYSVVPEMAGFEFTSTQQTCTITKITDTTVTNVSIPNFVTGIESYAFEDCEDLMEIVIPETITYIGEYAFYFYNRLIIYCEHESKPVGWHENWANTSTPVIWDCNNNEVATNGYIYTMVDGLRYGLQDGEAIVTTQVNTLTAANIASEVTYQDTAYDVTAIDKHAFFGCINLSEVVIPDGVTSIGKEAFAYCEGLTKIAIPSSIESIGFQAFTWCQSLQGVYITDLAAWCNIDFEIWSENWYGGDRSANPLDEAHYLYLNNELITKLVIPDSVSRIKEGVFASGYFTEIVIPETVTQIDEGVFYYAKAEEMTLPYLSTRLGKLFYGFGVYNDISDYVPSSLKKVTIMGGDIAGSAFKNCGNLTEIVLCDGVTSLGDSAFAYCEGLSELVIPETVTTIGHYAFSHCSGLSELVIPESVTSMGLHVFDYCSGLQNLVLNGVLNSNDFSTCKSLTHITIGGINTSIYGGAFKGCSNLTEVVLSNSIKSIDKLAFSGCSNLTKIDIPSSVTSIGSDAFINCSSLSEIVIPDSVTSIGDSAFSGCDSLTKITMPGVVEYFGDIFGETVSREIISGTVVRYSEEKYDTWYNTYYYLYHCYYVPEVLQEVTITSGVIEDEMFRGCSNLDKATIFDEVETVGSQVFYGCSYLKIYCEATNQPNTWYYDWNSSENPVVWDCNNNDVAEDGYVYITADGINYVLKDGVATVEKQRDNKTTVIIPAMVTYNGVEYPVTRIKEYALFACSNLTEIIIPDSVTSIGNGAFESCRNLQYTITDGLKYLGNNNNPYLYLAGAETTAITTATIEDGCRFLGSNAFDGCSSLTSVVIPDGVMSIGEYAFWNCTSLTSVVIPSSVTSIGDYAFRYCTSLTEITLPFIGTTSGETTNTFLGYIFGASLYSDNSSYVPTSLKKVTITSATSIGAQAFYNCSSLMEIVIPDSVTSIGEQAFYNCSGLTSVVIPDSVTSIGRFAFDNCSGLTSVELSNSITSIDSGVFRSCDSLTSIVIPDSVTSMGEYAFSGCSNLVYNEYGNTKYLGSSSNPYFALIDVKDKSYSSYQIHNDTKIIAGRAFTSCTNLTSIVIPDGVTSIGGYAFYNCGVLTEIVIPDSVTSIGNHVFYNCSSLTEIVIPDNVTSIGDYAFYNCTSLTEIVIPDNVTSIGDYAFYNCTSLTEIVIPDSVTSIGEKVFNSCTNLTRVVIGDGVTSIGNYAFYNLPNLTSVAIGDAVTSIGDSAFRGCSALTKIVIPDSVTNIGKEAFSNCSSLTGIVIGDGVTSIDNYAFNKCSSLTSVTFGKNSQLTSIGYDAFYNCSGLTSVVIPDGVTSVGNYAFSGCNRLTSVYYMGTAEEWSTISFGSSNIYLTNVTRYYYSESEPVESGLYWHYNEEGEVEIWA